MTIPLILLALLSIVGGFMGIPESLGSLFGLHESNLLEKWLEPVFVFPKEDHAMMPHIVEYLLMILSLAVAVGGCYAGLLFFSKRQDIPARLVQKFPRFHRWSQNKFYVDELYQATFVRGLMVLKDLSAQFDLKVIDGLVNLAALFTKIWAFFTGWFDRTFVDGLVNLSANVTGWGGAILRRLQSGQIQAYLYYAVGIILVMMLYRLL